MNNTDYLFTMAPSRSYEASEHFVFKADALEAEMG